MASWFGKQRKPGDISAKEFVDEYEVPSFESAILDVLQVIRDDESDNADIAQALSIDPGTSIRVLKLVNSAVFGLRQPVDDLAQAVQVIGRSSLESMLIASAVRDAVPMARRLGFDPKRFWRTSSQRAAVAGQLADLLCRSERSQCWTAALLQDFAVSFLAERLADDYGELLERWHAGEMPLHLLERETFGWDHAEIGASICERWQFPTGLTGAIAGHHVWEGDEPAVPAPVVLVGLLREGEGRPGADELLRSGTVRFGLDESAASEAVEAGFEEAEQISSLLS